VRNGLLWKIPPDGAFYLSYLLYNSMSQEQFVEASKCRNKKQEKRKLNRKNGKELSDDKVYTINLFR